MNRNEKIPIDFLRDIILNDIDVQDDRIMIWNNKSKIPNDEYLFIAIEQATGIPFFNSVWHESTDEGLTEYQQVSCLEVYNVDIMSRNDDALRIKEEVVMSLKSDYAQRTQEKNAFVLSKISPIVNISAAEGAANLFRFQITVKLQATYTKSKVIDYYNQFPGEVTDESGEEAKEFEPII